MRRRTFPAIAFSASAANLHTVAVIRQGPLWGAPRLSSAVVSVSLVSTFFFVSTFFLMANISCPISGCCFDGPLCRVLAHLRLSHRSVNCPADFVRENRLVQCSKCLMWFIRLRQHSATCTHLLSSSNKADCPRPQSLEQRADDDGITSLDVQCRAWETIDSLSVDEILHSLPPRTVQQVPYCLRTLFQECCSVPLSKISEDPGYDGGWKLLILLPRMIMRPHPRGGRSGIKEIKAIYH